MPFSDIDTLPDPPQRTDPPDDFADRADAFVVAMQTFSEQLNVFKSELEVAAALIAAAPAYADVALRTIADSSLTPAADRLIYYTGPSAAALAVLTSAARTLMAQTTQASMRTAGLGMSADGSSLVAAADFVAMRDLLEVYSAAESDADDAAVLAAAVALAAPSGAVLAFARSSAPTGWLKCNGAAVSRTTYSALFSAIGTTFGTGDGSTTFNLPDLRGEFVRGWDDGRGVDTGRTFGSAQADELESHTHDFSVMDSDANNGGFVDGTPNSTPSGTVTTGSTGGTETRPRNIALLYCIKT